MRAGYLLIAMVACTQITMAEGPSDRSGFDEDMCYGSIFVRAENTSYRYVTGAVPYCGELVRNIWNYTRALHFCFCTRTLMLEIVYDRIQERSRTYYILCGHCRYYAQGAAPMEQQYAPCDYPETTAVCHDVIINGWADNGICRSITEFWEIP